MNKEYADLSARSKKVLSEFQKNFYKMKKKKIVLYGIGKVSILLLKYLKDYNFVGIMDRDPKNIGKNFYGKTILDANEVKNTADIIIIISSDTYWNIIFDRISFLEESGIFIYYQNGIRAIDNIYKYKRREINYWNVNFDLIKSQIDKYEIISFDIFDTLIMRKLMLPQDVFKLIEIYIKDNYNIDINFSDLRNEAESILYEKSIKNFNIDNIYDVIEQISDLSTENLQLIKKVEYKIEKKIIVGRKKMIQLFEYALNKGKKVYLISDMYLPKKFIELILEDNNIRGYNDLFISNDLDMNKQDMSMWNYYKNSIVKKRSALHIGDNNFADVVNPERVGIDSVQIFSSYEMLSNSSIRDIIPYVKTINDSIIIGHILAKIFNDPFALNSDKGKVVIDDFKNFAYTFFGSIIFYYILWILNESIKLNNNIILFFARDGYLLEQVYNIVSEELKIDNPPRAIYFKTSRRLCVVASIKNKEDIYEVAKIPYTGKLKEYFKFRFGIDNVNGWNVDINRNINIDVDYKFICEILEKHEEEILNNSYIERKNYIEYMRKVGIYSQESISVVDPRLNGTIQYYLSKIVLRKYTGFYCNAILGAENIYGIEECMRALYQNKEDSVGDKSNIKRYSLLLEAILVAPEGMYVKCNSNCEFENLDKAMNQVLFSKKKLMHEGIIRFVRDILQLEVKFKILDGDDNAMFIDKLFGILCSNTAELSDEIKSTFYIDDVFELNVEKKILE